MADKLVTEEVCALRVKAFDERFARDKERLEKIEERTQEVSRCNIQLTEIIRVQGDTLRDHEERLHEIERRPRQQWDNLTAAIIAAGVSAVMAFLL